MAFLGTDLLSMLQGRLIEPRDGGATWPSGLWLPEEVHRYLHEQQVDVLRRTGCLVSIALLDPVLPATQLVLDLPGDCLAVVRVGWKRVSDGKHFEIPPADLIEADLVTSDWVTTAREIPLAYSVGEADSALNQRGDLNRIRFIGGTTSAAIAEVWYIAVPAPLAIPPDGTEDELASQDLLTVPDVGMPAVLWGTLKQQTAKLARGADPSRARYAGEMQELAIEAMRILLRGYEP